MIKQSSTAIWWIRRDLRITDNPALSAAMANAETVIPLFIIDPQLVRSRMFSQRRWAFLVSGLYALDEQLRLRGSQLYIRSGNPEIELAQLVDLHSTSQIFAEADHSPYARQRDLNIKKHLPLKLIGSTALISPEVIFKKDGSPYTVYTPFSKAWKDLLTQVDLKQLPPPSYLSTPVGLEAGSLPEVLTQFSTSGILPGELQAHKRLNDFAYNPNSPIYAYANQRDQLSQAGTSGLSPFLRFGMLSTRQVVNAALSAMQASPDPHASKGAETWLNELIWREFYIYILYHFPFVAKGNFRSVPISWLNDKSDFSAWCAGMTGYPIVDAAMRQLQFTGWIHNRARMIVASFLTKHLLIDWRWGEQWFMQHLIDGDPAANNGGWQWTAGTGTDAAPYFRIFNPTIQGMKFDSEGVYIRRWIPELACLPTSWIHTPWEIPASVQDELGFRPGLHYPYPIIDHQFARERALRAYQSGH